MAEIISLTVKTRRNVAVNAVQLIDIDDIAAPLVEANGGADTAFTLREYKKGPFPNQPTNTAITPYIVDQTISQVALLSGNIFVSAVIMYKGRSLKGFPLMGFNAKFIAGSIKPHASGSVFNYQEDSDPDLVEYIVSQTPAQILSQLSGAAASGWNLDGNSNGAEKYIGTNDNFDFPVQVNGVETFRFLADGTLQYPNSPVNGYVLTSDSTGVGTWQPPSGIAPVTTGMDPVISQTPTPAVGPAVGDRYLVGIGATGTWVGHDNEVAEWNGSIWVYTAPVSDDYVYVTDTLTTLRFNGAAWVVVPGIAILQNGNTLGATMAIGTNDTKNLWLKTNNTLRVRISAAGNVNVANSTILGHPSAMTSSRLLVVGGFDVPQVIIQANSTQSNSNPLLKFIKSDGTDLFWIHSDDETNLFVGKNSGLSNVFVAGVSGFDNSGFGLEVLGFNTTGSDNSGFGKRALQFNITGNNNFAGGAGAALRNTSGSNIVAIGVHAAQNTLTKSNIIAIGVSSVGSNNTGEEVVVIGTEGAFNTQGSYITAAGHQVLRQGINNSRTTAFGYQAGYYATGQRGIFIGFTAGQYETGDNKLFIDSFSRASESDARVKSLIYGVFDNDPGNQILTINGRTGIGVAPTEQLTVQKRIRSVASDIVVEDMSRGVIMKASDNSHYYRLYISSGIVTAMDLGTSLPAE